MKLSIYRIALCLLLLVAIPFQGLANAAMIACEFSRGASAVGHESPSLVHDTLRVHDTQHSHDTQHQQTSDSVGEHTTQHSCCSACVVSVLDSLTSFNQFLDNAAQFNYPSAGHLPPALAGLERPPRGHLG